jgi:hypothetical protein
MSTISRRAISIIVLALFSYTAFADRPDNAALERKPGEHQYKLVMSKDDKACKHMLNLYNGDMKKYGYEKYDEHGEFKAIKWWPIKVYNLDNDREKFNEMVGAEFDINNDGKKEFIIKQLSSRGGYYSDDFYMLKVGKADFSRGEISFKDFSNYNPVVIDHNSWFFGLSEFIGLSLEKVKDHEFQASPSTVSVIWPFILHGNIYLSMQPHKETLPSEWTKYRIVAKRKKSDSNLTPYGPPDNGVTDDICYFERVRVSK